jgi:hypothetical protein
MQAETPSDLLGNLRSKFNVGFLVRVVDKLLSSARRTMSPRFFDVTAAWLTRAGHFGLLAGAALSLLLGIIVAVQGNRFDSFLIGVGGAVLVLVLQYTAVRFLPAGDALIAATPTRVSSRAFLDCVGLVSVVVGWIALVLGLIHAIRTHWLLHLWSGVATFVALESAACVAFHPELANVKVAEGLTSEDEAVGVLAFAAKAGLRLVPASFGAWAIMGAVGIAIACVDAVRATEGSVTTDFSAPASCRWLLAGAALPFAAFLAYLMIYLAIAITRAILSIPSRQ